MKRFKIEQSESDIISHGGFALIGQAIKRYTHLSHEVDSNVAMCHGIKHSDVPKSYLGLLCIGKNDFEAINTIESEFYFMTSLDIDGIPCEATLRQRMDKHSEEFLPLVEKASRDFLIIIQPKLTPLTTGHIPLDADATPFDFSVFASGLWVESCSVSRVCLLIIAYFKLRGGLSPIELSNLR